MNPLELNIINVNMFWLLASDLASKYDVVDIITNSKINLSNVNLQVGRRN